LFIRIETASPRLFKELMKGKGYPFRAEQWPHVVLKGMETLNRNNWFPLCTWILGLPGETPEDTRLSRDLLHALKDAKWCVIPTLFVPLDDTRLQKHESAKLYKLTECMGVFLHLLALQHGFLPPRQECSPPLHLGIPIYHYLWAAAFSGKP
jgi:radical SAM superfamily enzyme YgiQ (UPF0313 family)